MDYGGGYGILTRMLRDKGVNAFWFDKYSENLLSIGFEYNGFEKVDVIVAFEVLEHLPNPLEMIKEIMEKTNCFIFSTLLLEQFDYKTNKDWWYFAPEGGQHIFLSSEITLKKISELLGCQYSNISDLHVFHRHNTFKNQNNANFIDKALSSISNRLITPTKEKSQFKSKTWSDHLHIKSNFNKDIEN